jgi:hypothetical protein
VAAANGEVVVMVIGVPAAATTMESAWVAVFAVGEAESVTMAVKFAVPAVVGVPDMTPVAGVRVRPAGSVPTDTDQL